jgi:drug/metabolite transporter (DMT)-like permease
LAGTIGSGVYSVVNRRLVQRNDTLELTGGAVIWGVIGLAPFSGLEVINGWGGSSGLHFNEWVVIGIVYSALGVTAFGFLALTWSLRQVAVAKVAVLYYLQPVSGVLLAWLAGDKLDWSFGIGSLLILAGVFLAEQWGKITA